MCKTPKDEAETEPSADKKADRRSYYYDDAHGYEDYDAAEEIEDDSDESA